MGRVGVLRYAGDRFQHPAAALCRTAGATESRVYGSGFDWQGDGVSAPRHCRLALWPEYGEVIGGRFFYAPTECRGETVLDSGYRHDVDHTVTVVDPHHPITAGLDATFSLNDELYLYEVFDKDVSPLLRSDHAFDSEHFYSAHHAVTGKMFCNENWPHPEGSPLIGWTKSHGKSRIAYLQPGDGPATYASEHYRRLLENAIRWAAERPD